MKALFHRMDGEGAEMIVEGLENRGILSEDNRPSQAGKTIFKRTTWILAVT